MLGKILKIFDKQEQPIKEITIEKLLELMAENEEEPPKALSECVNFRFLNEDEEFLFFGRIKTKECKRTKNIVVKVPRKKVMKNLPNLKKINGWEFKRQVLDKFFSWNQLMEEIATKKISSWTISLIENFKIEKDCINHNLEMKFISDEKVFKILNFKNKFEKKSFKLVEK